MDLTYIGCSGFYNSSWKGLFYPKEVSQKNWFKYYALQFNSLEINSTFYRYPKPEALNKWYIDSPAEFKFAVKAPRTITHYKKFKDVEQPSADFHMLIKEGLKEKIGCVLYQLPPGIKFSLEFLDVMISQLDKTLHNVIEFRDVSWWNQDVYDTLSKEGITFCSVSHASLPADLIVTKNIYIRFHGIPKLYLSEYSKEELNQWSNKIIQADAPETFIFFNNTITTSAVDNAFYLRNCLSE